MAVKDEYTFDFLELADEHSERQLEQAILAAVEPFLQEMGGMFAFVGSQVQIRSWRQRVFHRSTIIPPSFEVFSSNRIKDRRICTRICGQNAVLFGSIRRSSSLARRESTHRNYSMQVEAENYC